MLEEGLVRVMTLADVELLSQNSPQTDRGPPTNESPNTKKTGPTSGTEQAEKMMKRKKVIDPNEVLTKDAKMIKELMAPTAVEEEEVEERDEQRSIINEAFAGDDVVLDFLKDKNKQEEAGKPKIVDLTLPGWGEWGGQGLKSSRRKHRRFKVKVVPPPPRRDEKLPAIIISEKRDSSVATHQVSQLPFPFENPSQFEHTIRSPIGRTWNTHHAVKKITAPKVVTQLGAIIEPIAYEELMKTKTLTLSGKGHRFLLESGKGNQKKPLQIKNEKKHKQN